MFPGLSQFPEGQIIAFALVLLRVIAMVVAWPIFGTNSVPVHTKILLSITFSVLLFPTIKFNNINLINMGDELIFLAAREIMVGLALGFLMRMFFFAVSIAGEVISVTSGLSSAQLYNPAMGTHGNVIEQFEVMLASIFFLAMNGHHIFLSGLAQSFDFAPVADIAIKTNAFGGIGGMVQEVFLMGLRISTPVMIAVFLANVAMGIIGRAVPQINVLVTSMQVTLLLGSAVLFVTVPLFINELSGMMDIMSSRLFEFMKVM